MKKSKTHIKVVESAKTLFWKFGIKKVTVEDICEEAGISKMTFYRNFSNKQELAKIVIQNLIEEGLSSYNTIMNQDISFAEKMGKMVHLKHEQSQNISEEFIKDIYKTDESDLRDYLEDHKEKSLKRFYNDLQEAQQTGEIRKDIKIGFIMQMLDFFNQKMMDEAFLSQYENVHDAVMEITNFFMYGLFPPDDKAK
ncbi:MAG: TetR/AcrR family transcriptional regulator [Flammeovirgaceae bacterium]|nr:TetR/AcrR family transcriptional regulator [Flammeovirgaceae bacterium]